MVDCTRCKTSKNDADFLFGTEHWKVFVRSEQSYLGRCVIVCNRHVGTLSEITNKEGADLFRVIERLESAMKQAFGAVMFNVTCMMNDSYKKEPPNPHVHWHLRPRYNQPVTFSEIMFTDPTFSEYYDRTRKTAVSDEVRDNIVKHVQQFLR